VYVWIVDEFDQITMRSCDFVKLNVIPNIHLLRKEIIGW